jgi:hypothetical protein
MGHEGIRVQQLIQPALEDIEDIVDIVSDKCGTDINPQEYRNRHSGDLIFVAEDVEQCKRLGVIALQLNGESEIQVTTHAVREGLNGTEAKVHEELLNCPKRLGELVGRSEIVVDTSEVSKVADTYKQLGFAAVSGTQLIKKI